MKIKHLEDLNTLVSLSKRRGFVFQSSEIYGGLGSCWDYGPLGSLMKLNVKRAWWNAMTRRPDIVGLDAAILMHPMVWKASGHVDGFSDPLVDCKECKTRFRADNTDSYINEKKCPNCGSKNLSEERSFNLMFKTHMGPLEDTGSVVYLRPETAQGHFVNFQNCQQASRYKIPFGIAAIGKSFRNEITPGNFIFRTREFEQMEMQYFVEPGTDEQFFKEWKERRWNFYIKFGIKPENLKFKDHDKLAHYAKAAVDVEFKFPMGFSELEGIHNRSDFDLSQHMKFSGKNLEYFDEPNKKKYIPYVIETAVGCDRLFLAFLCDAYREEVTTDEAGKEDVRVVMGLHPEIAPFKVAVLPLSKKEELSSISEKLRDQLAEDFDVNYDESQSIGKRYRRQDEIGTPFCVTVDFDTINDQAVTVRHRDKMTQERVAITQLNAYIAAKLKTFNQ
ncbi:glycine--tRNA ligase [Bdellovibrio bacteriovorus]|uniref:glycine--tRNA ligase n=1 Tax=Bdellovibrio bacteriovorus TaxID=959 RepID=UPI00045BFFFC|nr:glycine--tRNA ligase [Bdellovibrio bacteriovorus]AHZ86375.1 glycine-tRNA synthetase subunit beta [Bdellovibrio bacteriovorus]BEV67614.1 Glycine--tRNA ligase [Bdellovibrio bacteriovorus]